jgi:hypothetical protein
MARELHALCCTVSFWCLGLVIFEGQLWVADRRLSAMREARRPLYNSSQVPALESRLKKSAFLIRSPSLHFQSLCNGECRLESSPVLAAPSAPTIFQTVPSAHSEE